MIALELRFGMEPAVTLIVESEFVSTTSVINIVRAANIFIDPFRVIRKIGELFLRLSIAILL